MKRSLKTLLLGAVALAGLQSSQAVTMLAEGDWTRIQWANSGNPGDPDSGIDANNRILGWIVSNDAADITRTNDNNDVFTFNVSNNDRLLIDVADIEADAERYSVLDFNDNLNTLGVTPAGAQANLASGEDDPNVTFADADWSSGTITVFENTSGGDVLAQVKIQTSVIGGISQSAGGAFIRARTEVIPEPSTSLLALLGMVGLLTVRRRKD